MTSCTHLDHIRLGPQPWSEEDETNRSKAVDQIVTKLQQHKEKSVASVRGKFTVTQVTRNHYNPEAAEITLQPKYSDTPEDNSYSKATPNGNIQLSVSNPLAVESLALGKVFYIDFTPAE